MEYAKKKSEKCKKKHCSYNVKMRKIQNVYAKKCETMVNYTSGKIHAENFQEICEKKNAKMQKNIV